MTVEIERVRDRIYLRSPYPTPGLGRDVPGANFSKVGGPHWSIPLTLDSCLALRRRFGKNLRVGSELAAWARGELSRTEGMMELGRAVDANLDRVPAVSPILAKAMENRTYQRVGARFIASGREVLIADQPGLGKTLEAIGGIIESGVPGPYLVVCPKTAVESVWASEIPRWHPGQQVVTVPDGRAKRDEILDNFVKTYTLGCTAGGDIAQQVSNTWVVVHPEMIRTKSFWICKRCDTQTPVRAGVKKLECEHKPSEAPIVHFYTFQQLFDVEWGAIVVDESHQVLIRRNGLPTQVRNGAELLRSRPNSLRIAMSGTPMRGKPHLLWGTLNWLRPDAYTAFWRWVETYYEIRSGYAGSRDIGELRPDRQDDLYKSLNAIMLRRTKAEVAPDMPEKTRIPVWLPMETSQQKLYDQMVEKAAAAVDGGTLNAIGILAEMTRLKQFATAGGRLVSGSFEPTLPSNKFNWIMEKLEELGFPDEPETKIVIVSQFTQILNLFAFELKAKKMGYPCVLTGEVTGRDRQETIVRFNEPAAHAWTPNIMLLNVKAGGVAITIDSADHMIFLDQTWIPDDQEQAEDRIHRVSKPRPVFYHYLGSKNSIEQGIAAMNDERALATGEILDGRRGIEFARTLLSV